jgi:hypothetical protein
MKTKSFISFATYVLIKSGYSQLPILHQNIHKFVSHIINRSHWQIGMPKILIKKNNKTKHISRESSTLSKNGWLNTYIVDE